MTASQNTATATATATQENTMSVSQNKECFKNFEWIPEVDDFRDRLEEEDYEGTHEIIESLVEEKAVSALRTIARDMGFDDAKGLVTHRDADLFPEEISYILSHINCDDDLCQGEERAKLAESFGDWDLMVRNEEYFFQHSDPNYTTGNLTMLEPGIVDGLAKAIFIEDNSEYFQVLDDDEKINAIIEDNYQVNKLVSRANRWLNQNSTSFDK